MLQLCSVFRETWNHLSRRCVYYKLLERGVLLVYEPGSAWYKSKAFYLLVFWVLVGLAAPYPYHPDDNSSPIFILLAGGHIAVPFYNVLESHKSLIPISSILQSEAGTRNKKSEDAQSKIMTGTIGDISKDKVRILFLTLIPYFLCASFHRPLDCD